MLSTGIIWRQRDPANVTTQWKMSRKLARKPREVEEEDGAVCDYQSIEENIVIAAPNVVRYSDLR